MKIIKPLLLLTLLLSQPALAKERCVDACSFGVFPYTSATQLRHTFSPIVEDMSFALDLDVHLTTALNLSSYLSKLKSEHYDIALAGPIAYSQIAHNTNYKPLARPYNNLSFSIFALDKAKINKTKDLVGHIVGKRAEDTGSWFALEALLKDAGIYNDVHFLPVNSNTDCLHKLTANIVDACSLASPVSDTLKESVPAGFKIIARLVSFPSSVYLVHKDVSEEKQDLLKEYLLERETLIEAKQSDYKTIINLIQKKQYLINKKR